MARFFNDNSMTVIGTIRENLTGTLSKIIVACIAVTFAMFFGWGTMFSNSDVNVVVSVNEKKIDLYDLDLEMARVQSILLQRFDDPNFQIEEEDLKSLAMNSLVTEALIVDYLKENNVVISSSTAYKLLSKNEIFLEEGRLSLAKVETYARQNGFLPGKYIQSIRDDVAVNYWRSGLSNSSFLTTQELKKNIELANQTRNITFTKLDKVKAQEDILINEEDVTEFYQNNSSLFQSPEKAKIKYVEINLKSIESEVSVTNEEIKREYQDYLATFDDTARRSVSHLMINIDGSRDEQASIILANKLRDEINKGTKFEDLVKEYSDDEGTKNSGGSLGVSDGSSFPEEFELAIRDMQEGEISEAVILESSVHILKLNEVQTPVADDFESKKKEIQQNLIEQISVSNYIDMLDMASESLFLNEDVDGLAKDLGLKVITKDYFSIEDSEGIFKESKLQKVIFEDPSIKEGAISDLIEINDQYALILEVEDFKDVEVKEFKEVKEEAEALLLTRLLESKMESIKQDILTQLQSGRSFEEVSANKGLKIESYKSLTRSSSLFTQTTLREIFNEPKVNAGKTYSSAPMSNGDILIFRLDEVGTASAQSSSEDEEAFKNFFLEERSESEITDLQIGMQENASIFIN